MSGRSILVALALLGLAATPAAAAPAKCTLMKVADLPVTMIGLVPTTPVTVNGHDAQFITDSGAFFSTVSPHQAEAYGLKLGPAPFGVYVTGVGGREQKLEIGTAATFELDKIPLKNAQFLVTGHDIDNAGGLLGQNILGALDTEYDLANGVIRLFRGEGCDKAMPAYWDRTGRISILPIAPTTPSAPHLTGEIKINGQTVHVLFDTGAPRSILSLSAARRLGFSPNGAGVLAGGVMSGLGPNVRESWIARFDSLDLGGEKVLNTQLRVADIQLAGSDMLLGADFFLSHRIYVAKRQHRMFITYNGGPVFRLDRPKMAAADDAPTPAPAPGAVADASAPTNAEGFSRRAAASAARRDYPAAVADYSRAIDMSPKDAGLYRDRALAHLAAHEVIPGMADLDQALRLDPDDVRALSTRGTLFLASKDATRADADFDAAIKAAPADSTVMLAIGGAYGEAGAFDKAIGLYDRWIAAHPKDPRLPQALNERCWTRALAGRDLDKALADCDAAIRTGARQAAMLDSRGLVHLRLKQYDAAIADYDASLKLQPKTAWSLYGRGLAEHAKGLKAAGDADLAAALALQPTLRGRAHRYGVEEATPPAAATQ